MLVHAARRFVIVIPLLLIVVTISFLLVEFVPGDTARILAGEQATEEEIRSISEALGLDRPLGERYVSYVWRTARGDLGESILSSVPIAETILQRLPITLSLFLFAFVIAVVLGLVAGAIAGLRPDTLFDRAIVIFSAVWLAVPTFVAAVFLILWFAIDRSWLPATGYASIDRGVWEWASHLILPSIALALNPAAELARMVRGALRDAMQQDYVRTARAKGLRTVSVVVKHASRNAAIPTITVLGLQIPRLLAGSAVIEAVFAIPGVGTLIVNSVLFRDVAMVQALVVVSAVTVIFVNLLIDLSYGLLNPRLRT